MSSSQWRYHVPTWFLEREGGLAQWSQRPSSNTGVLRLRNPEKKKNTSAGTSLVVWWLRLHSPKAGGRSLIPDRETRTLMLQLRTSVVKKNKIKQQQNKKPHQCCLISDHFDQTLWVGPWDLCSQQAPPSAETGGWILVINAQSWWCEAVLLSSIT